MFSAALAAISSLGTVLSAQAPEVRVDLRVELASLVARLAGFQEYDQCQYPAYKRAQDEWFASFADHPVVKSAKAARQTHGIGYDAVQVLAVGLDLDSLTRNRARLRAGRQVLIERWGSADVAAFVAELDDFAQKARFSEFMATQHSAGEKVRSRLEELAGREVRFEWFGQFFGESAARFVLVPGLCNGGGNFGPRYVGPRGEEEFYAVMYVGRPDSGGVPSFRAQDVSILVHEFSHSFVNPVLNAASARFAPIVQPLYNALADEFRAQAYGDAQTTLNESLVRASVVRYLAATRGSDASGREILSQRGLGFIWMHELSDLRGEYELDRTRYPTFASLLPRIERFYQDVHPRLPALLVSLDERCPKVVEIAVALDSLAAGAGYGRITILFDRPMRNGHSLSHGAGGSTSFPTVRGVRWDASGTLLTLDAELTPGRNYEFVLTGAGFASREGVPLARRVVEIRAPAAPRSH